MALGQVTSTIGINLSQKQAWYSKTLAFALTNVLTVILDVPCERFNMQRLFVTVKVSTNALSGFTITAAPHADAAAAGLYSTLYSVTGDFTTPRGILIGASGDLTVQAAGSTGWIILDTSCIYAIQLTATSGNAGGSPLDIYAGGE